MKVLRIVLICSILILCGHNQANCKRKNKEVTFESIKNNVCKELEGNVVVYAIFVDSKYTMPWSEYDINSTLDSIKTAFDWVEQKAKENAIDLNITIDYHQTKNGMVPIKNDLSKKTLSATVFKRPLYSGIKDIYSWADKIAKEAGKSFPKDTSSVTNLKNTYDNRERIIAYLRDKHKTDKVALMYFINNYYSDEISVTFDINDDNNVEFSIVSFKEPSVIAHEFLHLFGAYDLYLNGFERNKKQRKKKEKLLELFPNEIMTTTQKDLDSLEISDFTKYLIGWRNELNADYEKMLLGKGYFATKY